MRLLGFFAIIALSLSVFSHQASARVAITNGMLVRAVEDSKIYYIDHGTKRWISSPDTLHDQGFTGTISPVLGSDLASIPEGEKLTSDSDIILPSETSTLPDLVPFPMYDVHLATVNGRTVLRFTSTVWNQGNAPLELIADASNISSDGYQDTVQRIRSSDNSTRDKVVGSFLWHAPHSHYHFDDFADYMLEPIGSFPDAPIAPPVIVNKTTFCMRDMEAVNLAIDHAGAMTFSTCGEDRQGISVGWADVYDSTLVDQFIDVQDLPAGLYKLSFVVDPGDHFIEEDRSNNTSVVFLELNAAAGTMRLVASASPFSSSRTSLPDGTLVRGDSDPGVYAMQKGKKILISSEEMFTANGYSWDDVLWMPQSVVDAIPNPVIRLTGTSPVYLMNAHGFKRRILNPEVMTSYGILNADVIDVTQEQFDAYPDADLIRPSGSDDVFSIATKTFVGTFSQLASLGQDPNSVHVLNETDFNAYASKTVATELDVPWDIVFLPDGDMLVSERSGQIKRFGSHAATISLPGVNEYGEGGLMGLALHPDFASNHFLYVYFTATSGNRVVRYRLEGDSLSEDKVILSGLPSSIYHDGGQIAFGPDGMLYVTTGDAYVGANAPDLSILAGKTLRFTADGGIPSDNPFGTAVWSYGHRNSQGMAWDDRGRLWETEHGRSGALSGYDEINLIEKGKNYGWPDSQGDAVAVGTTGPAKHSGATVTWAPSGMAFTNGSLFFAGLKGASLYQASFDANGNIQPVESHFTNAFGRLRAVVVGPDGLLYVTTSNRDGRGDPRTGDDKVIQIFPGMLR